MIIPTMGTQVKEPTRKYTTAMPSTGLADVLFTPVQQRLLALLFGQPERCFQSAELIRLAGSGTGAAHRLLTRLAESGLVTTERVGNQKHYQANAASPVFAELSGLIRKTVGLAGPIQAALAPLSKKIAAAFIYGSVAKGTDRAGSDVDLMVVTHDSKKPLDYQSVFTALQATEASLARPVNPNLMSLTEWRRKCAEPDSFAARIAEQPRLFVIGSDDALN
jgi:predicted nucleotidyltransferase